MKRLLFTLFILNSISALPSHFYALRGEHESLAANAIAAPSGTERGTAWHGIMLDVSRHFMPIDFLYRQVEAMSHFGLNTLHLHLTDAAGWRIQIKKYPRLTELAAWRTSASWQTWWNDGHRYYAEEHSDSAYGGYYTQAEMQQLVRHADSLGVTIVPEVEFPAHSEEVTAAYPMLGCVAQSMQSCSPSATTSCADFCLGNEQTYQFVEDVVVELATLFTSPYLHMGGDEAAGSHWLTCPRCQAKMKELGISTRQQLQQYAMQRVASIVTRHGRRMIAWDEALPKAEDDTTAEKPIIMVWRDTLTARQAVRQGHDVILCPGKWYYLDAYQDAPLNEPQAMGGYTPLEKVYCRPSHSPLSALLGEQVNLWTEYIPDAQHAERMLWPRALCLSTWAKQFKDYKSFHKAVIREALPWLRSHGITPFSLEKEIGQHKEYEKPIHCLSTGKQVTYLSPYNETYAAGGPTALTDGLRGGWANNDGRWQGFISRGRLNVIIDLERVETIRAIESTFLQSIGPEIYLPEKLIISISKDGNNYTKLNPSFSPQKDKTTDRWTDYQTFGWHGKNRARYIHLQADCGSRGGWIFTDEVVVK